MRRPQGHSTIGRILCQWKIPTTPFGIEPATFRFLAQHLNDFITAVPNLYIYISCCNCWPWTKPGYITMTRRQTNNQWSGGIAVHPAPKNSECKNPLEISCLNCLGSRRHPLYWLTSKGSNYQRGVLLISAGAIEGHFEGKTPRECRQGGLVIVRQCPGSLGTCNREETSLPGLPLSWSPTLFSESGPVGLLPVSWTEKTIESSPFFVRRGGHCCRGDLVRRTTFWFFLNGLHKLEQRAKKCIELRGEYVE